MTDRYKDEFESDDEPSDDEYEDYDDLEDAGALAGAFGAGAVGDSGNRSELFDNFEFDDEDLAPVTMEFDDDDDDYDDDEDDDELGFLGFGSAASAKSIAAPESTAPKFDSPAAAQLADLIDEGPDHPYYAEAIIQRAKLFEKNGDLAAAATDYENFVNFAKAGHDEKNQSRLSVINLRQEMGQFDQAEQAIKKMLAGPKLTPRFEGEAIFQWVMLLIKRQKLMEALKVIVSLQRKFPRSTFSDRGRYYAGIILLKLKHPDRALKEFQLAAASQRVPQKLRAKAAKMMTLLLGGTVETPSAELDAELSQSANPDLIIKPKPSLVVPGRPPVAEVEDEIVDRDEIDVIEENVPSQVETTNEVASAPAPVQSDDPVEEVQEIEEVKEAQNPAETEEVKPFHEVKDEQQTERVHVGFAPVRANEGVDVSGGDELADEFEDDFDEEDEGAFAPPMAPMAPTASVGGQAARASVAPTFDPSLSEPINAESIAATLPFSSRQAKVLLMFAAVLSMLVHVGMAMGLYNRPLATIDADLLRQDELMHRVTRAQDMVLPKAKQDKGDDGKDQADAIEKMTKDFLTKDQQPDKTDQDPDKIDLNKQLDFRPDQGTDQAVLGASDFSVDSVLQEGQILNLPSIRNAGTGNGTSVGSAIVASRNRASQSASSILGNAVGIARPKIDPSALNRPKVAERLQGPKEDALFGGGDSAVIDFANLAGLENLDKANHLDQDFGFRLTTYQDPVGNGFFRIDITPKTTLKKLKTLPKDVVFLIDTSGSIPQSWVREIVAGVSGSLNYLNEDRGDRFNIVFFSDRPRFFSDQRIQAVNARTITAAQSFLRSAKAKGFTDMNQALSRLLVRDLDRVYDLVLISDGVPTRGVMKSRDLINLITRGNEGVASIFAVGVTRKMNREVLDFMSYRNKGTSVLVGSVNDARSKIMNKMAELRYPLLMNLNMDVVGVDSDELFPQQLPNIHQRQTISVYGRYTKAGPFNLRLVGTNDKKQYDFSYSGKIEPKPGGNKAIAIEWARWKIHDLYTKMDRSSGVEAAKVLEEIKSLAAKNGLKTLYDKD